VLIPKEDLHPGLFLRLIMFGGGQRTESETELKRGIDKKRLEGTTELSGVLFVASLSRDGLPQAHPAEQYRVTMLLLKEKRKHLPNPLKCLLKRRSLIDLEPHQVELADAKRDGHAVCGKVLLFLMQNTVQQGTNVSGAELAARRVLIA
jgi:hypothetical protein